MRKWISKLKCLWYGCIPVATRGPQPGTMFVPGREGEPDANREVLLDVQIVTCDRCGRILGLSSFGVAEAPAMEESNVPQTQGGD